jgi:hypothetical protein
MGPGGMLGVESSLKALVHACHMGGNYDEEDGYAAILSDLLEHKTSKLNSTDAAQSNAQPPDSLPPALDSPVDQQEARHQPSKQQANISDAEQHLNKVSHQYITSNQRPNTENRIQLVKDDITQQLSTLMSNPLTNLSPLQFTSIQKNTSEGLSTSVTENITSPKLDRMSSNVTRRPSLLGLNSSAFQYR